ncbi:MAG: peptidase M4, partial [Parafilimonas terrae]|nr:peptidase M4 [Parafilimonas terrae]
MLTRFLATAGALALTTGLALAQTTAPTAPTAPGTAPAAPATADMKDMKEFQAAKLTKISLAQAITTAEQQGDEKGGRAIDADFEKADSKDPVHYAVKVV